MTDTKARLEIGNVRLEFEGAQDFVLGQIAKYEKTILSQLREINNEVSSGGDKRAKSAPKKKRAESRHRNTSSSGDTKKKGTSEYKPTFNSDLDLGKLPEFYGKFNLKNHSEKILIFAIFLRDELGKDVCTADDIYSCYFTVKSKTALPTAFVQALKDAERRTHYIEFDGIDSVSVTIAGDNYYNQKLKQGGHAALASEAE